MARLTCLGAARTVTGSRHLLESGGRRILVDAGLFQGLKELRALNWQPLPVEATALDAVILTHAHLDHCGFLPRLVRDGFRGRVFCTAGTAELCRLLLPDAARLQEEDARAANAGRYSKHDPALPLFDEADAHRALSQLLPVGFRRPMPAAAGIEVEFVSAGHLLGSAFARVVLNDGRGPVVLFGGDLGRYGRPIMPDPSPVAEADVLLLESTYGDRVHPPDDEGRALTRIVRETIGRGGRLIVPSFAIGRVGEILYSLKQLEDDGRIPALPVYVDSPMALGALKYYEGRTGELDSEIAEARAGMGRAQRDVCVFCTTHFRTVDTHEDSVRLARSREPAIIVSSSGMATGGRVLNHLVEALPDARNTILFVGYQAAGTRGRRLVDGAAEVRMHGRMVPVGARIETLQSLSAHADRDEILRWLGGFERPPALTCLVHGEPDPMDALKASIERRYGWTVMAPERLQAIELPGPGG